MSSSARGEQHADALLALRAWKPPDSEQAALRRAYLAHLETNDDATSRECLPRHLTASTLVLDHTGQQVLLTLHAKAGRWFQFGGHLEPGDPSLAAAALREAVEESGLAADDLAFDSVPVQLSDHEVPFCGGPEVTHPTHHLDVRFVAVAPAGATPTVSDESADVRWWPVDALPEPEPDIVELIALARRRIGPAD